MVQQAALLDGPPLDAFALEEDRLSPAEVDVSWREVIQALVEAAVVVVLDEGRGLCLELAGQVVVPERDPVLQRLMPALDLSLGFFPWVCGCEGAPRTCSMPLAASHLASWSAM